MKGQIKVGNLVGKGAAINVSLGWVPDHVQVFNATDGTIYTDAFLGWVIPFSSGGVYETKPGDTITGATSGATAFVDEVLLASGSFAGGDAAGFYTVRNVVGTFGSENIKVGTGTDDATVTANVTTSIKTDTAAAPVTGNNAISRFEGVEATSPRGFTIGSGIATAGKLLRYIAERRDQ